jgi:F5/8 type C domain-containing protein
MARARPVLLAAAAYLLLTLAYLWPLPLHLSHGVPHDLGDPLLNAWILWWSTKALPLSSHWWNAPFFYPASGVFAFSEHLLGLFPIAAPLIALTHHPLLGYNVALLASYVFCGLGAYFLGYTLTSRHDAAFVAGLAFAFAPYRLAQLPHIQVLSAYWIPVSLAALHRYTAEPRRRWAVLAAGAWLMQGLACGYYLFFLSVLLLFWFLWFALRRWTIRQLGVAVLAWAVAALAIAPILAGYKRILSDTYAFSRSLGEIQMFSADVASLLQASTDLLVWRWLRVYAKPEGELFPGLTIIVLAFFAIIAARPLVTEPEATRPRRWLRRLFAALFVVFAAVAAFAIAHGKWRLTIGGVTLLSIGRPDKALSLSMIALLALLATSSPIIGAARRRSLLFFYVWATFGTWIFSLGPAPTIVGHRLLYEAPYAWLMRLPAFDGLRVPARFWMISLVCLSAIAALAIDRMPARARRTAVILATLGFLLDGWPRHMSVLAEPEFRPVPSGSALRLELPLTLDVNAAAMFHQTTDAVPMYNGFSGYVAPHFYALSQLVEAHDDRVLAALAAAGPVGIIVEHALDDDGALRKWLTNNPAARLTHTEAAWSSYIVTPVSWTPPPDLSGSALPIKSVDAYPSPPHAPRAIDGNLRSRWSGGVQQQSAGFTIELTAPSHVRQLVLSLAEFIADFPRRLRVEVSSDGATWNTVFLDDTALQTYYGAVRHPREVPIVLPIERDNVRWIRLAQLGSSMHDWSIAELKVLGF